MTPPFVGTILRMAGRGGEIKDNFNRSLTGSLGVTSTGGMPWSILNGTWDVNGTRPTTSTSAGSNPLAVLNLGVSNIDAKLTIGTMDALYFRVKDASNWWRLTWQGWQSSSCGTCCETCCSSTCYNTCEGDAYECASGVCYACGGGWCSCTCPNGSQWCRYQTNPCQLSCNPYPCNCSSCNCYSCNCNYYNNYRMYLQKSVAGSISVIGQSSTYSSPNAQPGRIVTNGSTITAYTGTTQFYSGAQTDHQNETKHGIGRGSYQSYNSSAMDDFEISWK